MKLGIIPMQICSLSAARLLLLIGLFVSTFSVLAANPTPAQIDALMRLSPAQQAQLAKQYGVELPRNQQSAGVEVRQQTSVLAREDEFQIALDKAILEAEQESLDKSSETELMPFGYALFAGEPTTFTPVHDVPVSSDYVLGPGDTIKLNLYGKENQFYELIVDTEGKVYLPELGPLNLAGLTFSEAKTTLSKTISQKMIGVKASVSMGELRSIRVFVLGDAYKPGSYVVSALSTMTNALVLSGGIAETGSLRQIQLKRKGEIISTLDLYDLLLEGDTRDDAQLKSGDVVFIPPVGAAVSVDGEVKRPAIYELLDGETSTDLITYSGGFTPNAYSQLSTIERVGASDKRTLLNADLSVAASPVSLKNGDFISVPSLLEESEQTVTVSGHVYRPGKHNWYTGMRLTDVISDVSVLKSNPDVHYGLIKRHLPPHRQLSVLSFNLKKALEAPGSDEDLVLADQDELLLFSLNVPFKDSENADLNAKREGVAETLTADMQPEEIEEQEPSRTELMEEIVQTLRNQATILSPSKEVNVTGGVRFPGTYPLVQNMSVEDLIYAAGGLTEKAFRHRAELNRIELDDDQMQSQSRYDVNLASQESLSMALKSRDVLQIKSIPEWQEVSQVTLSGEVMFPGVYPIHKEDSLLDVIERAGGFTPYAYLSGAVFTRQELKKKEYERIQQMQRRLEEDIAKAQIANANTSGKESADVSEAQKLLEDLKDTPAMGRLVIDLEKIYVAGSEKSLPLVDGDELFVPMKKDSVIVIGEVQMPISQLYDESLSVEDYIERSGGVTENADRERVYVIKANGGVEIPSRSNWFGAGASRVDPGDTVVVPLDTDKLDQIVLWRDMSQIFYQIALGAAAVGSL